MPATHPPPLETTLGALEIGVLIALFFFGTVTAQSSLYYQRFPKDPWHIKALVAFVWLLDVVHTILISCFVFTLTITYYGRAQELLKFTCLYILIIFGSAITWTEQVFFAFRIYKIMNRSYLGIICVILSSIRFIACGVLAAKAFQEPTFEELAQNYSWLMTTVLVGSACVDIIIAVSLCYLLMIRRDNTLGRTARIIDRLIAWTLQTGLITSITATVMVICLKTMPTNYIWLAVYMCLGKMYSNSLLASLNNRINLRSTIGKVSLMRIAASGSHPVPPLMLPVISIEMNPTAHMDDRKGIPVSKKAYE